MNRGANLDSKPARANLSAIEGRTHCGWSSFVTEWPRGAGEKSEKRLEAATGTA